MRNAILILLPLFSLTVLSQNIEEDEIYFEYCLSEGKEEFQKSFEDADYRNAINFLEEAVRLQPENTEALYFLGYAYSRLNSADGKSLINYDLNLTIKASEQFEKINKLTPKYTGESIILDPYFKIASEWGSMAFKYLYNNDKDSAIWAFNEGQKRGGYKKFILNTCRNILDICEPNSVLFCSGDAITFNLTYLQTVENYRKDVAVVDAILLNTPWYNNYLLNNNIISYDLPDDEIMEMGYCGWKDSLITIRDFSWEVKPAYYGGYILLGDLVMLNFLQKNNFRREVYYSFGFDPGMCLYLKDHLTPMVFAERLNYNNKHVSFKKYKRIAQKILSLGCGLKTNSIDELRIYDSLRYLLLFIIKEHYNKNKLNEAQKLFDMLNLNEKSFPYYNEELKQDVYYMGKMLE